MHQLVLVSRSSGVLVLDCSAGWTAGARAWTNARVRAGARAATGSKAMVGARARVAAEARPGPVCG